jgi:hypothetical protein
MTEASHHEDSNLHPARPSQFGNHRLLRQPRLALGSNVRYGTPRIPVRGTVLEHAVIIAIKLLHTLIWALLAGGIIVLPFTAIVRRFRWTAILTVLILFECLILALNRGRCPLSDLARHFTADPADNFDIYLPNWLARYNKEIFGTWFVAGEFVALRRWFAEKSARKL